ncbi:glycoside hydrolase family 130 protein [Cyclobacterium jeungdonense]|uniref:Glycoside hydrolase family 130 protein n=1 Tax=Cyclobacterium jeungdonense TaxID=708087 RepID=A0ABT8CDS5_9BACT|nr:glycoside hydrolase family 130 protein [Cyclobacterium jeungdonense]MDN3690557.1 glycoside hydrolase family 130 protein [Cyclobacterium jeungdonense]
MNTVKKGSHNFWFIISFFFALTAACGQKEVVNQEASSTWPAHKSWEMGPFVKQNAANPVLLPGDLEFVCPILEQSVKWEEKDVFNPAALVREGKINLLYRAEDFLGSNNGTSRIGLALSEDGLNFDKLPEPVFYPENDSLKHLEWDGGVEDPRIVESEEGKYIMTYTSYDGEVARLMLATSPDLKEWTKHGRVLKGEFQDTWSKAGAIVAIREGERILAKKIDGRYWMYFGDTDLFLAHSEDLINWVPLEMNGLLKPVMKPRPGYFDSRLVESGPYALLRKEGIVLLYNGMNLEEGQELDPSLPPGAYSAGQALFDRENPSKLIDRSETYFMTPEEPYEIEGQVNLVCFIEGMVPYKGNWFLYYGTADSKIAVAVYEEADMR